MKEIDIRLEAPRQGFTDIKAVVNGYEGQGAVDALKSFLSGGGHKELKLTMVSRGEIQEIELRASPRLQFRCIERIGGTVLDTQGHVITRSSPLAEGQEIQCPGMAGYYRAVVKKVEGDTAYAETETGKTGFSLQFGRDDRKCWVCSSVGSLEGLAKVKFT